MYAVIGVWTADPASSAEQDAGLKTDVIPLVKTLPGFVKGFWGGEDDSGHKHTNLIFDTEDHARAFTEFMKNDQERLAAREAVGITLVGDFSVVPVISEA